MKHISISVLIGFLALSVSHIWSSKRYSNNSNTSPNPSYLISQDRLNGIIAEREAYVDLRRDLNVLVKGVDGIEFGTNNLKGLISHLDEEYLVLKLPDRTYVFKREDIQYLRIY